MRLGAQTTMHSTTTLQFLTAIPKDASFRTPLLNSLEPLVTSSSSVSRQWESLVEAYTERKLSHQSDKLPALSALAERFGQGTTLDKTDYLSGHWRRYLPASLLWMHAWHRSLLLPLKLVRIQILNSFNNRLFTEGVFHNFLSYTRLCAARKSSQ